MKPMLRHDITNVVDLGIDRTDVEHSDLKPTNRGRCVSLNSWINQLMCRSFIVGRLDWRNVDDVRR